MRSVEMEQKKAPCVQKVKKLETAKEVLEEKCLMKLAKLENNLNRK